MTARKPDEHLNQAEIVTLLSPPVPEWRVWESASGMTAYEIDVPESARRALAAALSSGDPERWNGAGLEWRLAHRGVTRGGALGMLTTLGSVMDQMAVEVNWRHDGEGFTYALCDAAGAIRTGHLGLDPAPATAVEGPEGPLVRPTVEMFRHDAFVGENYLRFQVAALLQGLDAHTAATLDAMHFASAWAQPIPAGIAAALPTDGRAEGLRLGHNGARYVVLGRPPHQPGAPLAPTGAPAPVTMVYDGPSAEDASFFAAEYANAVPIPLASRRRRQDGNEATHGPARTLNMSC